MLIINTEYRSKVSECIEEVLPKLRQFSEISKLNDIISIFSLLKIMFLRSDFCRDMFGILSVPLIVLVSLAPVPGQLEERLGEYKLHSAGQSS